MCEIYHVVFFISYDVVTVNPYLAMECVENLVRRGLIKDVTPEQAVKNLIKALSKDVLKVMFKMGIFIDAS